MAKSLPEKKKKKKKESRAQRTENLLKLRTIVRGST